MEEIDWELSECSYSRFLYTASSPGTGMWGSQLRELQKSFVWNSWRKKKELKEINC